MYNLEGKVALVTGAGGEHGIGRGIAQRLAQEGADVVVTDITAKPYTDSEWGGLPAVQAEIEALGRRALALTCDVTDEASVSSAMQKALETMGRIDILVNNAGARAAGDRVPVIDLPKEEWDRVLNVNLTGTFLCSRAARASYGGPRWGRTNYQCLLGLGVAWDCPLRGLLLLQIRHHRLYAISRPGAGIARDHRQRHLPQPDPH